MTAKLTDPFEPIAFFVPDGGYLNLAWWKIMSTFDVLTDLIYKRAQRIAEGDQISAVAAYELDTGRIHNPDICYGCNQKDAAWRWDGHVSLCTHCIYITTGISLVNPPTISPAVLKQRINAVASQGAKFSRDLTNGMFCYVCGALLPMWFSTEDVRVGGRMCSLCARKVAMVDALPKWIAARCLFKRELRDLRGVIMSALWGLYAP